MLIEKLKDAYIDEKNGKLAIDTIQVVFLVNFRVGEEDQLARECKF